jgi:site-specific recombinase XerD
VADFLAWCDDHGVASITAVQPLHVATWIEVQTRHLAAPTVKLRLAAIRHLFDFHYYQLRPARRRPRTVIYAWWAAICSFDWRTLCYC